MSAKFDQKKIKQIIADAMTEFQNEYVAAYPRAVVHTVLEEAEGLCQRPSASLLAKAPVTNFRKQGWVSKRGAVVKSWKKRWFTVEDDYRVVYYKTEKDPPLNPGGAPRGKRCGEFSCFGCRVISETDEKSPYRIDIVPYWEGDVTRRTWNLDLSSPEEHDSWRRMFETCCRYAPNPQHKDPMRRRTFELTYNAMDKSFLGFQPTGTELEQLCYLVYKRVDKQALGDVLNAMSAPDRKKSAPKLQETVCAMITPEAQKTWAAATALVDKTEKQQESQVRQLWEPLLKTVRSMRDHIANQFEAKVATLIASLLIPVKEILPGISTPMMKTHKALIEGFVKAQAENKLRKEKEFEDGLRVAAALIQDGNYHTTALIESLPTKFVDGSLDLLEAAKYTYVVEDAKTLPLTAPKLLHDCLAEQHRLLTWFMEVLVMRPFNLQFSGALDELCKPLQSMVPVEFKDMILPGEVVTQMAARGMAAAVKVCTTGGEQAVVPQTVANYFQECGVQTNTHLMGFLAVTKRAELKLEEELTRKLEPLGVPPAFLEKLKKDMVNCCADCVEIGKVRCIFSPLSQSYCQEACPHRLVAALFSDATAKGTTRNSATATLRLDGVRLFCMRSNTLSLEQIVAKMRASDPWEMKVGQFYHERTAWRTEMSSKGAFVTLNAERFQNTELYIPRLDRFEDESTKPSTLAPATWDML